ncbi:MAG: heavy metal sensor histidine kinase [Gammaproteobacteria bacterium]|nr:heavy metal sensor histidine kinase [Gammaproteobacteria bacterium]
MLKRFSHFFKQLSISARLCALVLSGMFVILMVISTASYYLLNKKFNEAASKFLKSEIDVIGALLKEHVGNWDALNQEIVWRPQGNNYQFLAQITLGKKLARITPTMIEKFRGSIWPEISAQSQSPYSDMVKLYRQGRIYQVMTGSVTTPAGQTFIIKLAYDVTQNQEILNVFLGDLLLITVIGILIASFSSWFFIRFGLSPLKNFTAFLLKIDPKKHNERIDVERLPSELKPLAESFNKLLEKIEKNFDQLTTFSSNIAHELRTPINNLMLETEVILKHTDDQKKIELLLSSSLEEYQRLSKIIEKLLFLARADSDSLALSRASLDLSEELNKVIEFLQAFAEEKNMKIVYHGSGKLFADSTLLRQAFSNILTNAIKYGNPNTDIRVIINSDNEFVKIHVINESTDISDEHIQKLSERFYRIDAHRSTKTGGVGLGLSIVQSIMKAHDGRLEFSNKHKGHIRVSMIFPKNIQSS